MKEKQNMICRLDNFNDRESTCIQMIYSDGSDDARESDLKKLSRITSALKIFQQILVAIGCLSEYTMQLYLNLLHIMLTLIFLKNNKWSNYVCKWM